MTAVIFQFGKIFENAGGPRPGKPLCKRNIDITCTRVNHFISVWGGLGLETHFFRETSP